MNKQELEEQLRATHAAKLRSWGKLVSVLKRQFDNWASEYFFQGEHENLKMWYMPLIMNIGPDGINNSELAKKALMTKQAMSKIVKELLALGYIESRPSPDDKRCTMIYLTEKGQRFTLSCRMVISELEQKYEALVGKEKLESLKDAMIEIIGYNNEHLHLGPQCSGVLQALKETVSRES